MGMKKDYISAEKELIEKCFDKSLSEQMVIIEDICSKYNVTKSYCQKIISEKEKEIKEQNKKQQALQKEKEYYANESHEQRRDRILKTEYKALEDYPEESRTRIAKEIADKITYGNQWEEEKRNEDLSHKQAVAEMASIFKKNRQAEIFNELQPIFYDKTGCFWLWCPEQKKWEREDDVGILNIVEQGTGQDVITSRNRAEILNSLKQEGRKRMPKEIKPTWIQFKDKIYDVETGEEFEATPEYFVTNPIPWELHKERYILTPVMDRIFEEWVGKDNVQTLYEILAYSLIPDYPIHRIFCFIGEGMNGKSKFLELLRKFIGQYNCCSTELDTLLQSRFEVTRLHKKLVCQMGETNFNEMNKTSILKKLSGGDLIGFEYKGKTPFEEKNYAKIIIATNNLPTTSDKTIGFYRRWLIIDFPNRFTEKKDILAEIPEEEYEILAVKCSLILKDLLDSRQFTNEGSVEERMERYEAKSNFLEKFLETFTTTDVNGYITKSDFYKKFKEWAKENRHRDMSEKSVGMGMKKLGVESEKKHFSWVYDGKGGQIRCWTGIKWKD